MDVVDRFWARVVKGDGCWLWSGATNDHGYGQLHRDRRTVYAHRFSYELAVGPIPAGLQIDHLCRNRSCVRPHHLEPVTSAVNTRRGEPANRTHCPLGHPYDEANTGRRFCRACHRAFVSRGKARRRGIAA